MGIPDGRKRWAGATPQCVSLDHRKGIDRLVAVAVRTRWERDVIQVTLPLYDGETHFAYTTALATLCGSFMLPQRRPAFGDAQDLMPQCQTCVEILTKFVLEGLERSPLIPAPQCTSITNKGTRCARAPIGGSDKCSSHYPAARMYA